MRSFGRGPAVSLLLALLTVPAAAQVRTHCPKGSKPVRTVNPARPWACVLSAEQHRTGIECPAGSRPITTANALDPFKCALEGVTLQPPRGICPPGQQPIPSDDPDADYACEKVGKGFRSGPRCPRGSRPVPTPRALQPFKCVTSRGTQDAEPGLAPDFSGKSRRKRRRRKKAKPRRSRRPQTKSSSTAPTKSGDCPPGTTKILTENPFEPIQCLPNDPTQVRRLRYRSYRAGSELSFQYPHDWHLTDAWKDAEPSIYILMDTGRDGKPVSLSITRHRPSDEGYVELEARIWQEQDWHKAKKTGTGTVDDRPATFLSVKGESEMALIKASYGYYVFYFSAPPDLFTATLPAYKRLLKTARFAEFDRAPKPRP